MFAPGGDIISIVPFTGAFQSCLSIVPRLPQKPGGPGGLDPKMERRSHRDEESGSDSSTPLPVPSRSCRTPRTGSAIQRSLDGVTFQERIPPGVPGRSTMNWDDTSLPSGIQYWHQVYAYRTSDSKRSGPMEIGPSTPW
jgi:hypothetical protein